MRLNMNRQCESRAKKSIEKGNKFCLLSDQILVHPIFNKISKKSRFSREKVSEFPLLALIFKAFAAFESSTRPI